MYIVNKKIFKKHYFYDMKVMIIFYNLRYAICIYFVDAEYV